MSQDFFKKYFLVNISDSKGLKGLLFVILYIYTQAAVLPVGQVLETPT